MAYSNSYSPAQIMSMQKDAVRRVNEMQRIARERLRQTESTIGGPSNSAKQATPSGSSFQENNSRPSNNQTGAATVGPHGNPSSFRDDRNQHREPGSSPSTHKEVSEPEPVSIPQAETELVASPLQGILQRLNLDSESVILILMLLLLINEGADVMLIMALVYILL